MSTGRIVVGTLLLVLTVSSGVEAAEGVLSGTAKVWHPLTLSFQGPTARETDDSPNPFLDYRLIDSPSMTSTSNAQRTSGKPIIPAG